MTNNEPPDFGKQIDLLLRRHFARCYKCRRPIRSGQPDFADWSVTAFLRVPIGMLCPNCQSPEQRAEVAIRQATGPNYRLEGLRLIEEPKPVDNDDEGDPEHRSA
jgi:hypothetical protein